MTEDEQLVTLAEAARVAGYPYQSCYYRWKAGLIPSQTYGPVHMVRVSDVEKALESEYKSRNRVTPKTT